MVDYDTLRIAVIKGLKKYLNCPIIRNNQNAEPPPFPYVTYQITTPSTQNNGTYGEYSDGKARKPVNHIWSITTHSNDYSEALTIANKARDWLDFVGTTYLSDNGIDVQSVTNITDRSNVLTVDYRYSYGFDCIYSTFDVVIMPDKETIENISLEEDMMSKLENRLDGVERVAYGSNTTTTEEDALLKALEKRLSGEE